MSTRDTHRESPQAKGTVERTEASRADAEALDEASGRGGSAPDSAEEAAFFEGSNEAQNEFDPFRFQANTVPPGLRAELIAAQPEPVPSERWEDTVPPSPVMLDHVASIDTSAIEYDERNAPTLIIRRPRKSSRAWLIGVAIAAIFCVTVLAIRSMSDLEPSAPAANLAERGATKTTALTAHGSARLPASRAAVNRARPAAPTALVRAAEPAPNLGARAVATERPHSPERTSVPAARQGGAKPRQRTPSVEPARPRPAPAPAPAPDEGAGIFAKPFKPPSD